MHVHPLSLVPWRQLNAGANLSGWMRPVMAPGQGFARGKATGIKGIPCLVDGSYYGHASSSTFPAAHAVFNLTLCTYSLAPVAVMECSPELSTLSGPSMTPATSDPTLDEAPWYRSWALRQVQSQSQRLLLSLPAIDLDEDSGRATYFLLWDQIRELVLAPGPKSIDSMTEALVNLGIMSINENYESAQSAKDLVFAVLGWQTMLYKPSFDSSSTHGYSILDEMNGYRGEARLNLDQSTMSSNRDLPDFLLGFGMMLLPRNYCSFDDTDEQALFNKTKTVVSKDLDAHVLNKLCGVTFQWVDSLSCHLELDTRSGTLFLFRYPSFCVSSLRQHEKGRKSALHCCAVEGDGLETWAREQDVTELLREILLSYRLIFGQNRRSRSLFRTLVPFEGVAPEGHDQLLSQLCGRKRLDCPVPIERQEYILSQDFPHLRGSLVRLSGYASSKKPRSIPQLWNDRRDSTAWLAFWSVLIFGTLTIMLALLQTAFQILQYVDAVQQHSHGR